ncbi:MAG: hypothetical protein GTN53_02635 [Candidatus Aminicenantes bacterium]|nr:hypothetical protein [Candidatus Aminicenantes bacterium]
MHAVAEGHTQTVRALLERGADPNVESKRGSSIIGFAQSKGFTEIVELLEEAQTGQ